MQNFHSKHGPITRSGSGPTREQVKTAPEFERTREHNTEFGRASKAGRLIRTAFHEIAHSACDVYMNSRLNGVMHDVVVSDPVNKRGERTVTDGNKELVKGFEFNAGVRFGSIVRAPLNGSVNKKEGTFTVEIPVFKPLVELKAPQSATHFRFWISAAALDFDKEEYKVALIKTDFISVKSHQVESVSITKPLDAEDRPVLICARVQFFQEVNGELYELHDTSYNGMAIIEVDTSVLEIPKVNGAMESTAAESFTAQVQGAKVKNDKHQKKKITLPVFRDGWVQELHLN